MGLRSLRNNCAYPVGVIYCAASFDCTKAMTYLYLTPGFIPAAAFRGDVSWLACRHPARPNGARFVPGEGVVGTCRQPGQGD